MLALTLGADLCNYGARPGRAAADLRSSAASLCISRQPLSLPPTSRIPISPLAGSRMSQLHVAAASRRLRAASASGDSAGAAAAATGASGIASSQVRALLQGLPDRAHALAQQKSNLDRFLFDHAQEFAALPYHPWTKRQVGFEVKVDITSSSLPGCEGFRGVMLRHEHSTGAHKKPLLHYPGLLMTEALFQQFAEEYYCPTALELPPLTWTDAAGEQHRFLIVGDPTSAGAIINDGPFSQCAGQRLTHHVAHA